MVGCGPFCDVFVLSLGIGRAYTSKSGYGADYRSCKVCYIHLYHVILGYNANWESYIIVFRYDCLKSLVHTDRCKGHVTYCITPY